MIGPVKAATSLVLALVLSAALAACTGPAASSSTAAASPAPAGDRLDGTAWALVSMGDQPALTDAKPTLAFAAGTASGSSGCNTFNGPYRVRGPSLALGPLASTRKACPDALMAFEHAYLAALGGVTTWAVPQDVPMGTQLTLSGTGPKLVFTKPAGG